MNPTAELPTSSIAQSTIARFALLATALSSVPIPVHTAVISTRPSKPTKNCQPVDSSSDQSSASSAPPSHSSVGISTVIEDVIKKPPHHLAKT